MTTKDLTGKVALVTGAAQGVGEATARALAERGARLVLTDIKADEVKQVAASLPEAEPVVVVADLADAKGPSEVFTSAVKSAGQIDMLASVAGYADRGTIIDTTMEQWDAMMNLNLRAHFQLIQGMALHLIGRGAPGSIACAGSLNAYGGQPDLCAYSSSKGGLMTLVKHSAYALLPHRIRINLVNFGWMRTEGEVEIHRYLYGREASWLDQQASALPFQKMIEPSEAATLLLYLLTGDSSIMTGSVVDFDQSVPRSGQTTAVRHDTIFDWIIGNSGDNPSRDLADRK